MSETKPSGGGRGDGGDNPTFLALLISKLAFVIEVEKKTGKSTEAAQIEVFRQISQLGKKQDGDIITGKGVTKSIEDDETT